MSENFAVMGRFDENLLSEWEMGYLIGFFVGDGCLNFRSKYYSYLTKFVLNAKTENAIACFLIDILSKAGPKPWITNEGNRLNIRVSSKGLYKFFKTYTKYDLENGKLRKRLLLSKTPSRKFAFGVLAGLIDGDGHARRDHKTSFSVVIWTASKVLAVSMSQLAGGLGMKTSIICEKHSGFGKIYSCFIVRLWTDYVRMNAHNLQSLKLQQVLNEISPSKKLVGP